MRLPLFICIISVMLFTHCTERATIGNSNRGSSGKLFVMGGGARPEGMIRRMVTEAGLGEGGYGIILPMASAEPDSAVYYVKKQFLEIGVDKIYAFQISKSSISKAIIDSIENAALIYIAGGDQNRFMDFVSGTPLEEAIKKAYGKGGLVAGTSAGAALMGNKMITGSELKYPEYSPTFKTIEAENLELGNGLNLISNVIFDQHFIQRSRYNRLISAAIEHPEYIGIGIDEATALLVQGKDAEVIGLSQVILIRNPKKSKKQEHGKLGAKNIIMDIYVPGERFRIW